MANVRANKELRTEVRPRVHTRTNPSNEKNHTIEVRYYDQRGQQAGVLWLDRFGGNSLPASYASMC
jgi:hypothetical protein